MTPNPQLCQIAMCTADLPRTIRLYTEGLGFADGGGRLLWGERVAKIQALPSGDAATFALWWLVGRQDFVQLELFAHTTPAQKPLPADWRPSDLGWVRFGVAVPDFDAALGRLRALGVETLTEPVAHEGLRRVCFREPGAGVVVELLEEGAAVPGGIRPRHFDLVPAVVYAAVSIADLDRARRFFVQTLGFVEEPGTVLHLPEHEALWGLDGAKRESFVARGGDVYLEVVRYDDPPGRPKDDGYLLSDQGFMNVGVGHREQELLDGMYAAHLAAGYTANHDAPRGAGGTYVNDDQGTSVELLVAPRELDEPFGFAPHPMFRRPQLWPKPAVGPAGRDRS
jgi:catechol 2,3-dioxygenase-like lactoylglutathione lyase family enzyme